MQNFILIISSIVNSNFFAAVVTLIVGGGAFAIYGKQKRDRKKESAKILLLEITSAERAIRRIQEELKNDTLPQDVLCMPYENWSTNKYLFVDNFTRDEWDAINNFYNKCKLLDESIQHNNSAFYNDVEVIRENKQRVLADFAKETTIKITSTNDEEKQKKIEDEYVNNSEKFDSLYMSRQGRFAYSPNKPINDSKLYLDDLTTNLSLSSVGLKLREISE